MIKGAFLLMSLRHTIILGSARALSLIEKAIVPHDGFVTGPPHRAHQQFLDVSLQSSVGRKPDRILCPSLFQFLTDLRLSIRRIGREHYFLAQRRRALPEPHRDDEPWSGSWAAPPLFFCLHSTCIT